MERRITNARNNPDSSAYSRVVYQLGSEANQTLFGDVDRPLSRSSSFHFHMHRVSMPGWVNRSFARKTDVSAALSFTEVRFWRLKALVNFTSNDREQNGGLSDSTYSILQNGTGEFSAINGDIQLGSSAFNRRTKLAVALENEIFLLQGRAGSLSVINRSGYSVEKYVYQDPQADSAYYSIFNPVGLDTINDSTRLAQVLSDFSARVMIGQDSGFTVELIAGAGISRGNLQNNGQHLDVLNPSVFGNISGGYKRFSYVFDTRRYISGYNAGDQKNSARLGFDLSKRQLSQDTLEKRAFTEAYAKANTFTSQPALIYERYNSALESARNNLDPVKGIRYEAGITRRARVFSYGLRAGREERSNHVYFDADASVKQMTTDLTLMYSGLNLSFHPKHLLVATDVTYQWNERSLVYSLPDWVNSSMLATMWPLFKKKVEIALGVESIYFSSYYARGYFPHLDVMYAQSSRKYTDYIQLNGFVNARIKSVNIGFTAANFSYGFFSDEALIAPNYPRIPRYFMLTIDWLFKN